MEIVTLSERKSREAARRTEAARAVIERLRAHVRATGHAGRFIVFGSAAAGAMRYGSDFDVIIDFPPERESEAWKVVEDACAELDVPADILSTATTAAGFVEKILARPVEIIA